MAGVFAGGVALAHSPQLVTFSAREQVTAEAHFSPAVNLPGLNRAAMNQAQSGMQARAQMVKAIMPEHATQSVAKARPVQKNAVMRSTRKTAVPARQAWIVMTEWSETEEAPQLILTVARSRRSTQDGRSYAAVPTPNGWIFVEI
jgi:hypothetical protein